VDELASAAAQLPTAVLAGVALPAEPGSGKPAVNAAVLLDGGQLLLEQHKRLLPFYDVFDEQRYFSPARSQQVVELDGVRLAITICEDAWNDKNFWPRRLYSVDPMEELTRQHPALHINLSSSPFWHGKRAIRREMLAAIARRDSVPVLMCNQVGGDDSLIFDGSSLAINPQGEVIAQAASFTEDLVVFDPFNAPALNPHETAREEDDTAAAYRALVLGTRDYVRKCGFSKVVIALSGGIDSALVAAIARKTSWQSACPVPIPPLAPSMTAGNSPLTSEFASS
jgi:predicted amidohydrolase